MEQEIYDPTWIVEFAIANKIKIEIIDLLKQCTICYKKTNAYISFVPNDDQNMCQHKACIELDHQEYGLIVLDFGTIKKGCIVNDAILGIEFVDKI